jgi:arylformamidase
VFVPKNFHTDFVNIKVPNRIPFYRYQIIVNRHNIIPLVISINKRLQRIIDLTLKIDANTRVFPGSPTPTLINWSRIDIHGYDSEVAFLSTHTGTHMDAPSHFIANAPSIDKIDVNRFICNAVLVRTKKKKPDELILADEILVSDNDIAAGDTIVLSTAWEDEIHNEDYFSHNPGLSAEAAKFLLKKGINSVAIDSPSIDPGNDHNFTSHRILLSHGVLIIENLCNLSQLKHSKFTLAVAPLKFSGATGSPVRALAIEQDI